ncbi:hypothetical protein RFI_13570 [Reticulomyxa filosa]|uniref:Fe2OG dioxygenase domain-containing protein n=1 Tax=Reticulomyxa filosa TaxID=46433 RepID=X6NCW2_RETFI|nr:hypothetical protein RFI_13570 [Reticulomyxa filosa]|eukprot:ETO23609.1 hypothetical protein RFI_13570 [Reticulomyxa filosa]
MLISELKDSDSIAKLVELQQRELEEKKQMYDQNCQLLEMTDKISMRWDDMWKTMKWEKLYWDKRKSVYQVTQMFGGDDTFAEMSKQIIDTCYQYSDITGIEWIDFGLDELRLESLIASWIKNVFFRDQSLKQALTDAGILAPEIDVGATANLKIKGFVLREQAADQNLNDLKAFVYQAKGLGLNENGAVTTVHADGSHITLDLCLGESFEGGSLSFFSQDRSEYDSTSLPVFQLQHQIGHMSVFSGETLHCVEPIRSGVRINLVVFVTFP